MNIGLFCIDPGPSTGVAQAILSPGRRLAADAMKSRIHSGSCTLVDKDPMVQARSLWRLWEQFKTYCVVTAMLPPDHIQLISEDFVLTPMGKPGRPTTAPERVIWAFEGYRFGRYDTHRKNKHITPIVWQMPGAAHRFNSQKMLRPVDAWIVGKEHERSAFAHMYLRMAKILDNTA